MGWCELQGCCGLGLPSLRLMPAFQEVTCFLLRTEEPMVMACVPGCVEWGRIYTGVVGTSATTRAAMAEMPYNTKGIQITRRFILLLAIWHRLAKRSDMKSPSPSVDIYAERTIQLAPFRPGRDGCVL